MRRFLLATLSSFLLLAMPAAHADTVKVLTAGAFKPVLLALAPVFEARTGHTMIVGNDTAGALAKRVSEGEPFDLLVLTPAALRVFADEGRLPAEGIRPLARVAIGVAVPAGTPPPDVGTLPQFRQALLQARRVAYLDPAAGGSSGVYLDGLFERMGIAAQIRAKAVRVQGGLVAQTLVTGEADLAVHQISELLAVTGAELAGPIPESVQHYTTYAGAVGRQARYPEAADALLRLLAGETALPVIQEKGLYPVE